MTFTIAYFTDAHLGQKLSSGGDITTGKMPYLDDPEAHRENLRIVLRDIADRGIEDIVFGGDIGAPDASRFFFGSIREMNFRLHLVLGNHDAFAHVTQFYPRGKNESGDELFYAFDRSAFRLIFMDSSRNRVSDRQLLWLAQELKTDLKICLFIHHPVLDAGTALDRSSAALQGRDHIRGVLADAGKEAAIFAGHYHMDVATTEGRLAQVISRAVSYQIDPRTGETDTSTFGYRVIEFGAGGLANRIVALRR